MKGLFLRSTYMQSILGNFQYGDIHKSQFLWLLTSLRLRNMNLIYNRKTYSLDSCWLYVPRDIILKVFWSCIMKFGVQMSKYKTIWIGQFDQLIVNFFNILDQIWCENDQNETKLHANMNMNVSGTVCQLIHYFSSK